MQNFEIALAFRELADLLEFKGEDFFKVRAYRRAAKIIAGLNEPIGQLLKEGKLAGVPGIGKNILAKIQEIVTTGSMRKLEELRLDFPASILEIMDLPGIGPVTAWMLRAEVGRFDRFATGKQLARFCGVTPRNASSGCRQADAGLIKAGNPQLRAILMQAAHRLIRQPGEWADLGARLLKAGKPKNVVVAAVANRWVRWLFHQMQSEK